MHGDDVASTAVQITSEVAPEVVKGAGELMKGTAKLITDFIMAIKESKERKGKELHGDVKLLSSLRQGGDMNSVTMTKEDFELFKKANKDKFKDDIAYVSIPKGKDSDFVELYYLKSEEAPVMGIIGEIANDKLKKPEQAYKMTMIDKESAEAFHEYCVDNGIPVNLLETEKGEIKCIYSSADELKVQKATERISEVKKELQNTSIEVKNDSKGKPKFYISDTEQGKTISVKFGDKQKLERVLKEQFGYSNEKSIAASNILTGKLTDEQKKLYLSGNKISEHLDTYEKNIKFENEDISISDFTFSKIKLKNQDDTKLLITDKSGNYAVLSDNVKDRNAVEDIIKSNLGIESTEQMNALLNKTEHIGYVNPAETIKEKKNRSEFYEIKRLSQNGAEVTLGQKKVAIDLSDKMTAKNTLVTEFGMTEEKAEKIFEKSKKQGVTNNLINKAKGITDKVKPMIQNKNKARGSRT